MPSESYSYLSSTIVKEIAELGGSVSAEHGIGLEKKPYLHVSRNAAEVEVMKKLKAMFDPLGTLNPGKIF